MDGACSICFEKQDASVKDITFYSQCGQNFHEDCIDEWTKTRSTCPMCRAAWTSDPQLSRITVDQGLDSEGVQVYIDWLYLGHIRIDASIDRNTDSFNLIVLKCWEVSDVLRDSAFFSATTSAFFAEAKAQFSRRSIEFAFDEDKTGLILRGLVIRLFAFRIDKEWFKRESHNWPKSFVKALANRCLEYAVLGKKKSSFEEAKIVWFNFTKRLNTEDAVDLVFEEEDDPEDAPLSVLSRKTPSSSSRSS